MDLTEALNEAIDARLKELGLLEDAPDTSKKGGAKKGKEELDLDAMKEKFTALVEKKGKEAAMALLEKKPWGAKGKKLSDIDEKHFPKIAAAIDAETEADEDLFA